jgi:hypothetical protein
MDWLAERRCSLFDYDLENEDLVWTVVLESTRQTIHQYRRETTLDAAQRDAAERNVRAINLGVAARYRAVPAEQITVFMQLLEYHRDQVQADWRPDHLTAEDYFAA